MQRAAPGLEPVTDQSFYPRVANGITVIEFWGPYCHPCHRMEPSVLRIAERWHGRIDFARYNISDCPDLEVAEEFDVLSIPTLLIFREGHLAGRLVGEIPEREIEEQICMILNLTFEGEPWET